MSFSIPTIRSRSPSPTGDIPGSQQQTPLPPPTIIYHESARSIVFRDHIRRQHDIIKKQKDSEELGLAVPSAPRNSFEERILNYTPKIDPLPKLDVNSDDVFEPLLRSEEVDDVVRLMVEEKCVVKTVRNGDWGNFLQKVKDSEDGVGFSSSCSLLPSKGYKMRCFGSLIESSTGVIFRLPTHGTPQDEESAMTASRTYCWPAGYSAKTEYNIDHRGNLINGRKEALMPISQLRQLNHDYLHATDHVLYNRVVKGGLTVVPYNEVYVKVGGPARGDGDRSYETGVGRPVGMFCRTGTYGDIMHLLRTRARYCSLNELRYDDIPLYHLSPERGIRAFTPQLQNDFWHFVASHLNPFQNPHIQHKTGLKSDFGAMKQKLEELIDIDDLGDYKLTREECAKIAGGFGATDDSVAKLLMDVVHEDKNNLQSVVNEGLTSAVRAGDYHTSRQLLILYTLVASRGGYESDDSSKGSGIMLLKNGGGSGGGGRRKDKKKHEETMIEKVKRRQLTEQDMAKYKKPPPPPPPLDTDRLRSATNHDGLLSVLGAAEVLKGMQDGGTATRVVEVIAALEEWIHEGERDMTFRLTSWHNQRVAQGDLKIATNKDTNFGAFISGRAVSNRRKFVKYLKDSIETSSTDFFETVDFLHQIHNICAQMNSPCLRLELLQYILGLDNRYSVAHVARSVELAATCLNIQVGAQDDKDDGHND